MVEISDCGVQLRPQEHIRLENHLGGRAVVTLVKYIL